MEERNYRKGLKPLKKLPLFWLWMPIIHCLMLSLGVIVLETKGDPSDIMLGLIFVLFYAFVAAPITSIWYCKRIHTMGWTKYICCIYNAVMTGMYFAVFLIVTKNYYNRGLKFILDLLIRVTDEFSFLSVFIPALICGLITLITYDKKNLKAEDTSLN